MLESASPQESLRHLLPLDAAAVVRHAQEGNAAFLDFHRYRRGTGVHRVFQKLLYHAGGTFHHFPCRYFIYGILIQQVDLCHPLSFFRLVFVHPFRTETETEI